MEENKTEKMIFVDTSAIFALYNTGDIHHARAVKYSEILKNEEIVQVTSNIIISETLTLISMRVGKETAVGFGKALERSNYRHEFINEFLHQKAWRLFQKIKSKNVSFFDCTSFAVMEALGIKKAFTFDREFRTYGFDIVPA